MLSGKIALITGSTTGLGLAIATRLARAGSDIMLHGILQPDEAEAARATLAAETGRRVWMPPDLQEESSDGLRRLGASIGRVSGL